MPASTSQRRTKPKVRRNSDVIYAQVEQQDDDAKCMIFLKDTSNTDDYDSTKKSPCGQRLSWSHGLLALQTVPGPLKDGWQEHPLQE